MPHYFNRASSLTGLVQLAPQAGPDLSLIMHSIGLDPALLQKPDDRIAFADVCSLMRACADAWNMPDLGLRLAPYQSLNVLGPIALVTRMESSMRAALQAIIQNLVIHSNAIVVGLEEHEDVAALIIDLRVTPPGANIYALLCLGVGWNVIRQVYRAPVPLYEVVLRAERRALRTRTEAYFSCPVRSGAGRNALYFDRKILDARMHQSDPAYHAIIERYLNTSRREVAGRASENAAVEIARQMEMGNCTLHSVASALRTEPRSLQRRLKQDGTSFRELLDDWRRARSLTLVTQTRLPLSEISVALGYLDQSIFSRAFRRWHGSAPQTYRQNMQPFR